MRLTDLKAGRSAVVEFDPEDLIQLSQLLEAAAHAVLDSPVPEELRQRDDLHQMAATLAAVFELAAMVACGGQMDIKAHRQTVAHYDFPNTPEGQRLALEAKRVDDMLEDVGGLDGLEVA